MATVGAFEARTHLSRLLRRVQRGERITITKHGKPVAMLVPVNAEKVSDPGEIIEEIRKFRKNIFRSGLSLREMIEEGRS